jgi:hypothetical protein
MLSFALCNDTPVTQDDIPTFRQHIALQLKHGNIFISELCPSLEESDLIATPDSAVGQQPFPSIEELKTADTMGLLSPLYLKSPSPPRTVSFNPTVAVWNFRQLAAVTSSPKESQLPLVDSHPKPGRQQKRPCSPSPELAISPKRYCTRSLKRIHKSAHNVMESQLPLVDNHNEPGRPQKHPLSPSPELATSAKWYHTRSVKRKGNSADNALEDKILK